MPGPSTALSQGSRHSPPPESPRPPVQCEPRGWPPAALSTVSCVSWYIHPSEAELSAELYDVGLSAQGASHALRGQRIRIGRCEAVAVDMITRQLQPQVWVEPVVEAQGHLMVVIEGRSRRRID